MKRKRSNLCFCGSGKTYKECCFLLRCQQKSDKESHNARSKPEVYSEEEIEILLKSLSAIRRISLDYKPYIKEYDKLRKMHGEILGSMMRYFDQGKFIPEIDHNYTDDMITEYKDRDLRFIGADFNLETKEGNHAFVDMMVYKRAPNWSCITEDFINRKRYKKPEKVEFLQSMLESKSGLFRVIKVDLSAAYVYIEEVFNGDKYKLVDIGLSGMPNPEKFLIYTRIITCRGICFSTGLNLAFQKNDPFIKQFINNNKKTYSTHGEFIRFIELYNRFSTDPNRVKTTT
ncbi:MAG: SEC-C domain-containing protein [Oscillospiraceae bacterium]|nr:SEC-C domain-containing protein [Oscillospiraceae bacterium]